MPMLGPMTPYHQLILAAQYQQQQQQILQHPRPQIASQDFFETMQRFIQLRNAGTLSNDNAPAPTGGNLKGPSTPTSEAFKKDTDTTASPSPKPPMASNLPHSPALNLLQPHPLPVATSSPEPLLTQSMPHLPQLPPLPIPIFSKSENSMALNNNHLVKSEDELKREEEMVEDEMKEEEDELDDNEDAIAEQNKTEANSEKDHNLVNEKSGPPVQGFLSSENFKQIQLNWLKKMYEDLQKNKGIVPPSDISAGLPCKFACGKNFTNPLELYQHQDNCQNNENNVYEESLVSDSNDQDQSMLNGLNDLSSLNGSGSNGNLNASNSSGDERKVRVRTLISDEQLAVLKSFYHKNPRPKREELERISSKIGHPFKVVKVWFQNSRARDRREGKPVLHPSGGHLPAGFF